MIEWIGIDRLAELKGYTKDGARRWALKHTETKYVDGVGRGGRVLGVKVSSLPDELRSRLEDKTETGLPALVPQEASEVPATELLSSAVAGTPIVRPPLPIVKALTPEQERAALARVDLVAAIREQKRRAHNNKESKTKTVERCVELYNCGYFLPGVLDAVGKIDLKTIYRWDKQLLKSNNDYRVLAPRYGNNRRGATNLTQFEQDYFLRVLLDPNHFPIGTAIGLTHDKLKTDGITACGSKASYRRFAEGYKAQNNHIWVGCRYGEKALDDQVLPHILRDSTMLAVGEVLIADGHTLNFEVINPFTGKPGRATLLMFIDWRSRYPLGFEIMMTENVSAIHAALRNAILTLGRIPDNVLLDNGKAFRARLFNSTVDFEAAGMAGLYGRLGIQVRFARAFNAKDKPIERFFKTFGTVERMLSSYTGASIEDKPARMRPNEKIHKALHKPVIPTIAEAVEIVNQGLAYYASQPHEGLGGQTPIEVFGGGKGPGVDKDELKHLMMSAEVRDLRRRGVRMFGDDYWSEAIMGMKDRVIVRYDIHDLSRVLLYGRDGSELGWADRLPKVDPLLRQASDLAEVKRMQGAKRTIVKDVRRVAVNIKNGVSMFGDEAIRDASFIAPKVLDIIEAATEARTDVVYLPGGHVPPASNGRPTFRESYERYEWHKKHGIETDVDSEWIARYEQSGEWHQFYGLKEAAVGGI